ncbi:MAG TPA: ABC transporter permease [Phycisphaerae bacterium]|nr:ABC transporter permease [Phycisphaerae bacterium]
MTTITHSASYSGRLFCSPLKVFSSAWNQRTLILRLARREIEARYRGSVLGIAWSLIVPLVLLAVYTFVFSIIFKARWDMPIEGEGAFAGKGVFALVLFTGLILFNVFAECVTRAPSLMLDRPGYIKKVVFPLETFAWVTVVVALFNAAVSSAALLIGYLLLVGLPPLSALTFPLMVIPLVLLALGLTWFLSSVGVYLRDMQQFVPVLVTIAMFMSPIFYPKEALPPAALALTELNPLAVVIEAGRWTLFPGELPDWTVLTLHFFLAWLVAWLGFMWFNKTRKGFADVV